MRLNRNLCGSSVFEDDIVIHSKNKEQVEEDQEVEVCSGKKRNGGTLRKTVFVCK